jgi:hypothetical protein
MPAPQQRAFPLWAFHPFRRAALAVRYGAIAEWRLSHRRIHRLNEKPRAEFLYVSMASRSHWLLLRESLLSMHLSWDRVPEVAVVSDGSWTESEFLDYFSFWESPIWTFAPDQITRPLLQSGDVELRELAHAHPLGLKLAAIVHLARTRRILFADSDILWFADPTEILAPLAHMDGPAALIESGASFNRELAGRFCPELLNAPSINTGCVWLGGELCSAGRFQQILQAALLDPTNEFNEQTIIAIAARTAGNSLPAEFCLVDFEDAFSVRRRKPWKDNFRARHYVRFMRHQFFRDALLRNHRFLG